MPVLPACLVEPLWGELSAQLPERPPYVPTHPLGRHRARVPDRVVVEHVLRALAHGSGCERLASPGCSARTIRRRVQEWARLGPAEVGHTPALRAYDRMIGLEPDEVAVDGGIAEAPSGGEAAGRSPVDRGKQGLKRSVATDGAALPRHPVSAGADRHDRPRLAPTLAGLQKLDRVPDDVTAHLDRASDATPTRVLPAQSGFDGAIAREGVPAPAQAGTRGVVERTLARMNGYGKLRRCTEKRQAVVDFYLFLAAALAVIRQLIQRARRHYRWPARPTTRRLK